MPLSAQNVARQVFDKLRKAPAPRDERKALPVLRPVPPPEPCDKPQERPAEPKRPYRPPPGSYILLQGGHYASLWEAKEGEEGNGNCRNTQTIPVTIQGSIAGRDKKGKYG